MPILKQVRRDRRNPESCKLLQAAANVTSQSGEDGILACIFELIGEGTRWCVEFGAWDGRKLSNTWNLLQQGWHGVLIEGDAAKFAKLRRNTAGNPRVTCLHGLVQPQAGPGSLDGFLSRTAIPQAFDLLSIDIDGNDYHVWASLAAYRPRVVVIEYNPCIPNDVVFVQDCDPSVNQGCSLRALVELGRKRGFELACVTESNGIFIEAGAFGRLGIADNDIDAMAFPKRDAKYFDGYDGTLFHVGLSKLNWVKDGRFDPNQLQVLEPSARRYGHALDDGLDT